MPESTKTKDAFIERALKEDEEDFHKFHTLAEKWKEETLLTSSVDEISSNQSYLHIIGMGRKVLPYIFQDLKARPALWFPALEAITGSDPIKPSHSGIIRLMIEDWLKWGEENGYV